MAQVDQGEYQFQQWASQYDPTGSMPDEYLRRVYVEGLDPGGQSGHWADPPKDVYIPPMQEAQTAPVPEADPNYAFAGPRPYVPPQVNPLGPQSAMNPFSRPAHPLLTAITDLVQFAGRAQHSPTWGAGEALGAVEQAGEKRRVERLKSPAAQGYNAPVEAEIPEGLSPDEQQVWVATHAMKQSYVARQQMLNMRIKAAQAEAQHKAQLEYDKDVKEYGTKVANSLHSSIPGVKLYPDDAVPFDESARGIALRGVKAREESVGLQQDRIRLEEQRLDETRRANVERESEQAARDAAAQGREAARDKRATQAHQDKMNTHKTNAAQGYGQLHSLLKDIRKDKLEELKRVDSAAMAGQPPTTAAGKKLIDDIRQLDASMGVLVNESAKALGVPFDQYKAPTRTNSVLETGELDLEQSPNVHEDEPSGGR